MKQIATDIYTFEELIRENYVYVDKTEYLYQLINRTRGKQFFLSRPRRFGKSLLLSTIQCIFEGKRELFKSLYIDTADFDWQTYSVIRLDMNSTVADNIEETEQGVKKQLEWNYRYHHIDYNDDGSAKGQFEDLIRILAYKSPHKQVVLLIDEYDKPILDHLGSSEVLPFQRFLKQFYGVVKSTESLQRFCLMTGVSKFSKVSIFSDLNNLVDITMDPVSSTICGFTHKEVKQYFSQHIQSFANKDNKTPEEIFDDLCKMYDGYCFDEEMIKVFNPVSLGRCLSTKKLKSSWFETGTPGGLMEYLKTHPMDLSNYVISSDDLGTYEPDNPGTVPLLFQTGYLTIKGVEGEPPSLDYVLDFPNLEVQNGFNRWLAKAYINRDDRNSNTANTLANQALKALRAADIDTFINIIKQMFSAIPYELLDNASEHQYHALFHNMLYITASNISSEVQTNLGRIDSVVETGDYIYVIEFKLDKSAHEALEQIKDRKYYEKYMRQGKQLILLGINFSKDTRNIDEYTQLRCFDKHRKQVDTAKQ